MIGYLCKYTPVELFSGFGEPPSLCCPDQTDFTLSDSLVHANLCSYAKAVLQYSIQSNVREMVFTNCCDSLKRVYDVLKDSLQFHFMLNLPRVSTPESARLFSTQLLLFIQDYSQYSKKVFDIGAFKKEIAQNDSHAIPSGDHLVLAGARVPDSLLQSIQNNASLPVIDQTCAGQQRRFSGMPDTCDLQELMDWYAAALLNQLPCMRMQDVSKRNTLFANPQTKGILYHTIKFCDYYGFEYARCKESAGLPMLKLETDYTKGSAGQIDTRLHAFYESMGILKKTEPQAGIHSTAHLQNTAKKGSFFCGIDCGSTSTDAVLIDENKKIVAYSILPTGARSTEGATAAFEDVLQKSRLQKEEITSIITTGYGRNSINFGDKSVTEITCHAKGAFHIDPAVRTIIDIGGQDSKIIKLDHNGSIIDFSMNDKCAAGTGRFLDMMANTLGIKLEEFAVSGLQWREDIQISSMCSVFAESEVISLIAQNKAKQDIIHGLNCSITARVYAMIARLKCVPVYMMTGGVAKNRGVVSELSHKLEEKIHTASEPQICGALGAALIAAER